MPKASQELRPARSECPGEDGIQTGSRACEDMGLKAESKTKERGSGRSHDCYVSQAGRELEAILLPLNPWC